MALFNTFLKLEFRERAQIPDLCTPPAASTPPGRPSARPPSAWNTAGPARSAAAKCAAPCFMDFFGGTGRTLDQAVRLRTAVHRHRLEQPIVGGRNRKAAHLAARSGLARAGRRLSAFRRRQPLAVDPAGARRAAIAPGQRQLRCAPRSPPSKPARTSPARAIRPTLPPMKAGAPASKAASNSRSGEERRIEIAPGFHRSVSHAAGTSVPSNIFSIDWLPRPLAAARIQGNILHRAERGAAGHRRLSPGLYSLRPLWSGAPLAAAAAGPSSRCAPAPRLSFHLFSGVQDDRNSDLTAGGVGRNLVYGANFYYRLAPNVLASFEASQARTSYVDGDDALEQSL